jgi:2-methylcitrate dehydratase
MKLGAGVVTAAAAGQMAPAQEGSGGSERGPAPGSMRAPGEIAPFTGPGYVNNFNRLGGNGPMDDTTAKIVKFVHEFKTSDVTPAAQHQFDRTMIDSLAAIVTGFELEEPRIAAKLARMSPPAELKCTMLGYNIPTTPELATFANGVLIRETDFDDTENNTHYSTVIPAALALGEALHSSGAEVMTAIVIAYELQAVPAGGESVVAAMAAGKLMGLDEDRLANALTMALTPHIALNKGVGAMSMWKNVRSAESAKCGVWAAMLAREGMTGPPQPFEGRGGLWSTQQGRAGDFGARPPADGMGRPFKLPVHDDSLVMQFNWFKRRPAEASSQGILYLMKDIRAWVKPDEVAAIHFDTSYGVWEEICDAPKWDPRNRQTADHSLPYIVARALLDGDIYIDSYTEAKFNDPAARDLMNKTTMAGVNGWGGLGMGRLTITKKSGEVKDWDTYNGNRNLANSSYPPLTEEELKAKFDHACAYQKVKDSQRDEAYKVWGNLSSLKDFADAMKIMANFGQPKSL